MNSALSRSLISVRAEILKSSLPRRDPSSLCPLDLSLFMLMAFSVGDPGQARRARKKGTEQVRYLKPYEVCDVPEESREPGFPVNQGDKMPRSNRSKKK
jgi:hypothetical protein